MQGKKKAALNEKQCSKCGKYKHPEEDFYMCQGRYRAECKRCTIKRNSKYQKLHKTWLTRNVDVEARREYMKEYYAANKQNFATYRERFRERNPSYWKKRYLEGTMLD